MSPDKNQPDLSDNPSTDQNKPGNDAPLGVESLQNGESLEKYATPVTPEPGTEPTAPTPANKSSRFKQLLRRFNLYLLLFIAVLLIAAGVLIVSIFSSKESKEPTINSQSIPTSTLKQLSNTDATVGDPKQVLNVQSNAVFSGKVLIRDNLDVAGQINVGGSLSLPGITVSGDSQFDQVQINKALNIGGDATIQGQMIVKKGITVTGGGNFSGPISAPQITTNTLQLIGDLNITRHIAAGGPTPGRTVGSAVGSGGTASISGSDTGGSININTGSNPSAGCYVNVSFAQRFNSTPHVIISPVGSAAAGLSYYTNRSTTGFSVCVLNSAPASSSFAFDYFVLD